MYRPFLSVRAFRLTFPEIDVAVTVTFSSARLSGPVTRPRMMSVCCASAGSAAAAPSNAAQKAARAARKRVM